MSVKQNFETFIKIFGNVRFLTLSFCVVFLGSFALTLFAYSKVSFMCFILGNLYVLAMVLLIGLGSLFLNR